jgi:hypothetical protein
VSVDAIDRCDHVAGPNTCPPGRPVDERGMHHDPFGRRREFEAHATELLIERSLEFTPRGTGHERRVLVEFRHDSLHSGGLEQVGIDRLEVRPLDGPEHLADLSGLSAMVTSEPGHERHRRDQQQQQNVALGHGGNRTRQ